MAASDLTAKRLRELFHYDPGTGIFTNLTRRSSSAGPGEVAGSVNNKGYIKIILFREAHYAHRLAWLYMNGRWPKKFIDHKNGIKTDNRICNLREADDTLNAQNIRKATKKSKSGILGVSATKNRFRVNFGKKYIGTYDTEIEAHEAYLELKRKHHAGCTI